MLGVQYSRRRNRRGSAGFGRFSGSIGCAETALAEILRPIRPDISTGLIRDPFFEPAPANFEQSGHAGKPGKAPSVEPIEAASRNTVGLRSSAMHACCCGEVQSFQRDRVFDGSAGP